MISEIIRESITGNTFFIDDRKSDLEYWKTPIISSDKPIVRIEIKKTGANVTKSKHNERISILTNKNLLNGL